MKTFKVSQLAAAPVFQGDIMLRAVSDEGVSGAEPVSGNVIAHSETGHHHTAEHAKVFGLDPMTMFLKPNGKGFVDGVPYIDIVHHREVDKHESFRLLFDVPDVVIKIKRQRERVPEGWKRVED